MMMVRIETAFDVKVVGIMLYTTSRDLDSFVILDISDKNNPSHVGDVSDSSLLYGAYGFDIAGTYAYVAAAYGSDS